MRSVDVSPDSKPSAKITVGSSPRVIVRVVTGVDKIQLDGFSILGRPAMPGTRFWFLKPGAPKCDDVVMDH
jgi:hypothetical protein